YYIKLYDFDLVSRHYLGTSDMLISLQFEHSIPTNVLPHKHTTHTFLFLFKYFCGGD
ncbi:hypothetical protein Leryth_006669, partial [Lithospermum erythrorhizon]